MQMLYNSENFAVVQFEVEAEAASVATPVRGGYEIVDKQARREIFLQGSLAEHFKQGVENLIRSSPSEEEIDDYLEGFTVLAQQPVVLH
ncbi:MAG: hypothetical protein RLY71_2664 [Pseudomonadota bacterium]